MLNFISTKKASIPKQWRVGMGMLLLGGIFFSPVFGGIQLLKPDSPQASVAHGSIFLNGNTAVELFCAGNESTQDGSAEKPFLLENYEITGGSDGIALLNINHHVLIRGCTITGASNRGVYLNNCSNINITNTSFSATTPLKEAL